MTAQTSDDSTRLPGDGSAPETPPRPDAPADGNAARDPGIGYEQARTELADIVRKLETGGLRLEESLALWERGERLADVCQRWLDGARERLETALRREEGAGEAAAGDRRPGQPAPAPRR